MNLVTWYLNVRVSYLVIPVSNYVVSFIMRQANMVAHSIARATLSYPNPISFGFHLCNIDHFILYNIVQSGCAFFLKKKIN